MKEKIFLAGIVTCPCLLFMALHCNQNSRHREMGGSQALGWFHSTWFWECGCGLWIMVAGARHQQTTQTPDTFCEKRSGPASQPQPVTGRFSANKLAFMWWRRQCKKFIIVRETSCVSVELLTFDNYSLKIRQNSACLK